MSDDLIRIGLLSVASIVIVGTALRRMPGVGIMITLVLIAMGVWLGPLTAVGLGLVRPAHPWATLGWGLALGFVSAIASLVVLEPGIERLTGKPHDLGIVDSVRGNTRVLLQWIVLVWLTVAILEELVFRGFFISQISLLLGGSEWAALTALLLSSALFGIGHTYQGTSGILSTGAIGTFLGAAFLVDDYNLLLPILIHGFFDSIHLILIWAALDTRLRGLVFRRDHQGQTV